MFTLEIITPDGIILNEEVDEIILPTPEGQITILPHHIPLYAKLSEGEVHIKKKGASRSSLRASWGNCGCWKK